MDPGDACEDPDLIGDDVPESVWNLKLYGPDIHVLGTHSVPSGWILVDRNNPSNSIGLVYLPLYISVSNLQCLL